MAIIIKWQMCRCAYALFILLLVARFFVTFLSLATLALFCVNTFFSAINNRFATHLNSFVEKFRFYGTIFIAFVILQESFDEFYSSLSYRKNSNKKFLSYLIPIIMMKYFQILVEFQTRPQAKNMAQLRTFSGPFLLFIHSYRLSFEFKSL